jgi:hypothetical protein
MATLQVLQNVYTANADLSPVIPADDTVPTATEGTQVLSQSITLASSASKVLIEVSIWGRTNATTSWSVALFRGSTCIAAAANLLNSSDVGGAIAIDILDQPLSVGPHVYSVRAGPSAGGIGLRLNGIHNARRFGGAGKCTLTLREIG